VAVLPERVMLPTTDNSIHQATASIPSPPPLRPGPASFAKTSIRDRCGVLRVFLHYLSRERHVPQDLSRAVGAPQTHRLSGIPRAVTWEEVRRMLAQVERRTVGGRRDYAILLLLVTYGLRGREVAA